MGVNGIYGLSGSGLDIESMVKVGMMSRQNEYDKMQQKFTQNEWQKTAYLDVYSKVLTFNTSTLSQYKMSNTMNARNAVSSNESAVSATANANASNMTHYVQVESLASAAYLVGAHGDEGVKSHNKGDASSIKLADALFSSVMEGEQETKIDGGRETTYNKVRAGGEDFEPDAIAFQFSVGDGVNGVSTNSNSEVATVDISASAKNGTYTVDVSQLASNAVITGANLGISSEEDSLRDLVFSNVVKNDEGTQATFTNLAGVEKTFSVDDPAALEGVLENEIAMSFTLSDGVNSHDISFSYLDIMNDQPSIAELNRRIKAFEPALNIGIELSDEGQISFVNSEVGSANKIAITPADDNAAAFFNGLGLTNPVTGDAQTFAADETVTASGTDAQIKVDGTAVAASGNTAELNGITYTAESAGTSTVSVNQNVISVTYQQILNGYTFNDLASAINGLGTNVRASYDSVQDSFSFYNKESGAKNNISFAMASGEIGERTAEFFNNLGLQKSAQGEVSALDEEFAAGKSFSLAGTNASAKIDGVAYDNLDSNKVTVNGVNYTLNYATTEPVTVSISQDTDKIVDKVKSFVEDYNKLLSDLQELYNEKPNTGYTPLTDAQKAEMKDEQITKWEEKAKEGLLYHDRTLGSLIDKMRDAVTQRIDGLDSNYNTIYSIGISTTGTKGQLTLNEDKLRSALAEDPNAVYNVFAKLDADDNYNSNGIAQRLGDVLSNGLKAVKTRAGSDNGISEDSDLNNLLRELQTKMSNFKVMMNAFEDKLYKKYDAMESTLALLGAQLNYVTGAFGS